MSYWTGIWEPHREAISKEVALLRATFAPTAPVVSFSAGQRTDWRVRDNVIRLSGRRWLTLRALAALRERQALVTHIVFDMSAWHLLRALGRRPILFTVVVPGAPPAPSLVPKVTTFVAETAVLAHQLEQAGVARERIRIIHPGVDLQRFRPARRADRRFTVLFASSPSSAADLEARGIPLLIEAARLCPDIDFTLLWRQWGDASAFAQALDRLNAPANVRNVRADVVDMAAMYHEADAIAFINAEGHGKSCPNSVVEAVASGCPAVVSNACGLADMLDRSGAGIATAREPRAVAAAIQRLRREYPARAAAARALAVREFDVNAFLSAYRQLYQELGVQTAEAPSARGDAREPRVAATGA